MTGSVLYIYISERETKKKGRGGGGRAEGGGGGGLTSKFRTLCIVTRKFNKRYF